MFAFLFVRLNKKSAKARRKMKHKKIIRKISTKQTMLSSGPSGFSKLRLLLL